MQVNRLRYAAQVKEAGAAAARTTLLKLLQDFEVAPSRKADLAVLTSFAVPMPAAEGYDGQLGAGKLYAKHPAGTEPNPGESVSPEG